MPHNLVRWQREGDLHFVTMSCHARLPYLTQVYTLAVDALERTRERYSLKVVGHVLMPNHLHLLVSEQISDCCPTP